VGILGHHNGNRRQSQNDGHIHLSDIAGSGHFSAMAAPDAVAAVIFDRIDGAG